MAVSAYSTTVTSNIFRLASFIFLRVIPVRIGKIVLPSLYLAYLISLSLGQNSPAVETETKVKAYRSEKGLRNEVGNTAIKSGNPFPTILLSLPTPSNRLRWTSFIINTLLLVFAFDLVLQPLINPAHDTVFTRIGAIDPDSAKVVVRYPMFNATEVSVKVVYRKLATADVDDEKWTDGPILRLSEEKDWVNTGKITGLWPSTPYEYRLALVGPVLDFLSYPSTPLRFRTFPDPRLSTGTHFRFIASSCTTPNFPYIPGQGNTIKGFDLLADYIWPKAPKKNPDNGFTQPNAQTQESTLPNGLTVDGTSSLMDETTAERLRSTISTHTTTLFSSLSTSPASLAAPALVSFVNKSTASTEFMLFLGDFIYADVPYYFGDNKEAYQRLYRRNYASDSYRKVYERLPVFHIYDDHEIIDNYAGLANDSRSPFPNASRVFEIYNAESNYDPVVEGQYYYNFRYGDVAFFVLDTRRYRSNITEGDPETRSMLGDKQVAALQAWLALVNQTTTFKFIVSSVPFTSLWTHSATTDSWAAYSAEKAYLLTVIHSVPNVIILSGDRHEFAAIEFNAPSTKAHNVLEFSTSPLSMFYVPFFRTLKKESQRHVERWKTEKTNEEGIEHVHETIELVPEERVLKYIPTGNYKWSSFEIDTRNLQEPVVHVEVMVDGKPAYRLTVAGTPVNLRTSTALGAFIPQGFKGILDKIGLQPSKWF